MSALNKIAFYQNRLDEVPNQELAGNWPPPKTGTGCARLPKVCGAKTKTSRAIALRYSTKTGYLDPALIADYAGDFLKLLKAVTTVSSGAA